MDKGSARRTIPFIIGTVITASAAFPLPSFAASAWFFDGECKGSHLKRGTPADDMRTLPSDQISCAKAVLIELKNGRKLMQFIMGDGSIPLGFGGSRFDRETNPKLLIMHLDRIYPVRDLGSNPAEIYRRSRAGEGVLDGAEGFCFFSSHQLDSIKELSCVAMHQSGNQKVVYRVMMELKKVRSQSQFPDLEQ